MSGVAGSQTPLGRRFFEIFRVLGVLGFAVGGGDLKGRVLICQIAIGFVQAQRLIRNAPP